MGHGLGASHGVAYVAWQKQIHAGKSQVQRALSNRTVPGSRPAPTFVGHTHHYIACVGPLYERAGTGSGLTSRPYFRRPA